MPLHDVASPVVYGPGSEISYTQITSPVNIASTTESSPTTIISPGAVAFDGLPVLLEFFSPLCVIETSAVGALLTVTLFESTTQITRLLQTDAQTTTAGGRIPLFAAYRFTPTNGLHTYTIGAHVTSTTGTPSIQAGSGGTAGYPPAYVRFIKV